MAQFLPKFARQDMSSSTDMNMSSLETEGPYALKEFKAVKINEQGAVLGNKATQFLK